MRTEYSQTFAAAGGLHTTEISARAIFGRGASGALEPIDTTLVKRDGAIVPNVSAAPVEFPSGGGATATLRYRGTQVELKLPGDLHAPTIAGSTARYDNVFPGVNLLLTATPEGMRQVYEVTTREASHLPELLNLNMGVKVTGARLAENAGGGLAVIDHNGYSVFQGPAPAMWDSSSKVLTAPDQELVRVFGDRRSVPKPYVSPVEGDRISRMAMTVGHGRIQVTPNQKLMTDPHAKFPIYIDPTQGLDRTERTMISSGGWSEWQFVGDEGMGRCPYSLTPSACGSSFVKRLYYEFPRETLNAGDYVVSAEFGVKETHATSCSARTVWLRQTNQISSSTAWPGPATVRDLGQRNVAYGYNSSCPDAEVAFRNSGVKAAAAELAAGTISRATVMLRAENESDEYAWKRFADNPVLRVDFMRNAATPTAVGVLAGSAYTCGSTSTSKTLIGTNKPTLRAQPQTEVEAAGTTYVGLLKVKYDVQRYDTATSAWVNHVAGATYAYRPAASSTWVGDNTTQYYKPADDGNTFVEGTTYRFRALTQSHFNATPDVDAVTVESPWSGYCYFHIDADAPLPPVVTSLDGKYPTDASDGSITWGGGPGDPGQFGFAPSPSDNNPNIASYVSSVTDNAGISRSGIKSELATVTPAIPGVHVLSVNGRDIFDRNSLTTAYQFYVGEPSQPDGRWHVTSQDTAAAVSNTGGLADTTTPSPLVLSTTGVVISPVGTGRRGNVSDDRALKFSGGTASVAGGVIKTDKALSVSAWVRPDGTANADGTVFWRGSTDGATGFALRRVQATNTWSFEWRTPTATTSVQAVGRAIPNAWTLLTATYNPTSDVMELFVNGRSAGTTTAATTATAGPLSLGGLSGVASVAPFAGYIDEATVWQRTVPAAEASILASTDFETGQPYYSLAGSWSTLTAAEATLADQSAYAGPQMVAEGGATLDSANRLINLDGVDDALVAAGPVVDETGPFTVQTNMSVASAGLVGKPVGFKVRLAGQRGTVANGYASWAVWFEKVSDTSGKVVFARWKPSADGGEPAVVASTSEVTPADAVVTLNAVYEPAAGQIHLYSGEIELGSAAYDPASQGSGELAVGKGYQSTGWADRGQMKIKGIRIWAGALSPDQLAQTQESDW